MKQTNSNILFMVIGVLIALVIGLIGFIALEKMGTIKMGDKNGNNGAQTQNSDVEVTVYTDNRCKNCATDQIVAQMQQIPFLTGAKFTTKEFAESGVSQYLTDNKITTLPAFVFNTNSFSDPQFTQLLIGLDDGNYVINPQVTGANFDPFAKRSEKGYLTLDTQILADIKKDSYISGNTEAKITWLEYSDLECPYCAKLHNSGTVEALAEKYGSDLNKVFQHFPLGFHANAKPAALVLECLASQKGADAFYSLIKTSFEKETSTKSFLIDEAVKLGADKTNLEKCIDDKTFEAKVDAQTQKGQQLFGITGTPGSVLINNQTGEYDIISGAYPTESFVEIIDNLLK